MDDVEIGQVLWFKIRFNNAGDISETVHPYVIYEIDKSNNTLELIQINSIKNENRWKLSKYKTKSGISPMFIIPIDNPQETVIYRDSFAQLNNKFLIENFRGIEKYRTKKDKLSKQKLKKLFEKYKEYHEKEFIDDSKQIYINKEEFMQLNPNKIQSPTT